ncbi:MAG: SDR family NAD(P)-dependent oxidoreductase [Gammaproteobacteria bacterium]|jgi:short-subunit dehydrogenase|nr:SDR family NAD(P)-dependent oxidoreductase [Gammaproteobacteria bacterium]
MMAGFQQRYGPWAVIAGGAQGIGAAYARHLAQRGLKLIVIDRSAEALQVIAAELVQAHGTECATLQLDLADADRLAQLLPVIAGREVGMLVYNAALADVGPFYKMETGLALERRRIAVNVTGPLELVYALGKPMLARGRGGIILMSSGAGLQGAPYYAHYAATKAYAITLAESLWHEFQPYGVDVLACIAGMTLSTAASGYTHLDTSGFQTPEEVVSEAMTALGRSCSVITGEQNRQNRALLATLPREQQVGIIGRHAIDNFLGGVAPPQRLDDDPGVP